jgi:hypothetical protein
MLLSMTDLPQPVVATLASFNIREVEHLLSMGQSREQVDRLARVLRMAVSDVVGLLTQLRTAHPNVEVPPAKGPRHPTGVLPRKTNS